MHGEEGNKWKWMLQGQGVPASAFLIDAEGTSNCGTERQLLSWVFPPTVQMKVMLNYQLFFLTQYVIRKSLTVFVVNENTWMWLLLMYKCVS